MPNFWVSVLRQCEIAFKKIQYVIVVWSSRYQCIWICLPITHLGICHVQGLSENYTASKIVSKKIHSCNSIYVWLLLVSTEERPVISTVMDYLQLRAPWIFVDVLFFTNLIYAIYLFKCTTVSDCYCALSGSLNCPIMTVSIIIHYLILLFWLHMQSEIIGFYWGFSVILSLLFSWM